jgi:hypothetical protein
MRAFGYSELKEAGGVPGGCGQAMGFESTFACKPLTAIGLACKGESRFRTPAKLMMLGYRTRSGPDAKAIRRWLSLLAPAQRRSDMLKNRFHHVHVVRYAQLVRNCEQDGIGLGDCLVLSELLD